MGLKVVTSQVGKEIGRCFYVEVCRKKAKGRVGMGLSTWVVEEWKMLGCLLAFELAEILFMAFL